METNYPGWRKKYTVNDRKLFSRYNIAVKMMKEEAIVYGGDIDLMLAYMDGLFTALSPFVKKLQERKKNPLAAVEGEESNKSR